MNLPSPFFTTKRFIGKSSLYVLTLMIDTPVQEDDLQNRLTNFVNTIPSNDYSFNIMKCDFEQLRRNRRLAKI